MSGSEPRRVVPGNEGTLGRAERNCQRISKSPAATACTSSSDCRAGMVQAPCPWRRAMWPAPLQ